MAIFSAIWRAWCLHDDDDKNVGYAHIYPLQLPYLGGVVLSDGVPLVWH